MWSNSVVGKKQARGWEFLELELARSESLSCHTHHRENTMMSAPCLRWNVLLKSKTSLGQHG